MAFLADKRPLGDRYSARRRVEQPLEPSALPPLPYFPNLRMAVRSVTASLVLTYLEIHCPAPQDPQGGLSSPPVTLSMDAICADLQVSRRTLKIALSVLGVWWRTEAERFAAARAGREFINPDHSRHGTLKPYSVVGKPGWARGATAIIRRNRPRIAQMLAICGLQTLQIAPDTSLISRSTQNTPVDEGGATVLSPSISSEKSRLAELLMRASVLDGDRRRVRYPRLRAAVGDKLLDAKVLSAKQPKRKAKVVVVESEGVDPALPEVIRARMGTKRKS